MRVLSFGLYFGTPFTNTSQVFNALAFILILTSAYMLVVLTDTCPNHERMVLISTPASSRCDAVE